MFIICRLTKCHPKCLQSMLCCALLCCAPSAEGVWHIPHPPLLSLLQWLEEDLARVDRCRTPWLVVSDRRSVHSMRSARARTPVQLAKGKQAHTACVLAAMLFGCLLQLPTTPSLPPTAALSPSLRFPCRSLVARWPCIAPCTWCSPTSPTGLWATTSGAAIKIVLHAINQWANLVVVCGQCISRHSAWWRQVV